jgi:hypothetical protein
VLLTYVSMQLWHCVSFLVLVGNSFGVTYILSVHLCGCVSFLDMAGNSVVAGNSSQNENAF